MFRVQEQPYNYLLDREGKIAGKAVPKEKWGETISTLLKSSSLPAAAADERDKRQKPDEVIKLMNLKPGGVIVDIGAGEGYFTRRFALAVGPDGKAIGVEIDAKAVSAMTADARRLKLANYEARLVPPDDPMLAPQSVDVLFLCDAYHHINDRVSYFANVKRALKPGGKLVIIDFVKSKEHTDHSVIREEVIDELRRAGYRLTKEHNLLLPRQYFFEFEPGAE